MNSALLTRAAGFILSLILTLCAYYVIIHPEFFDFSNKTAVLVIFIFALIQAFVQLMFFMNIWKEEGPPWNLTVLFSTITIIFIVIFFSIWIINHLNYHMH